MKIKSMKSYLTTMLSAMLVSTVSTTLADDYTWIGGTSTAFNSVNNYSPLASGTGDFKYATLIFNSPTSDKLAMTANINVGILRINSDAGEFTLNKGSNRILVFVGDGMYVESGAKATINATITRHTEANQLKFYVEEGGELYLMDIVSPVTRPLIKDGGGLLYLGVGTGAVRSTATIHLNEGTTFLGSGAVIKWEDASPKLPEELEINLGTGLTQATLAGSGSVLGHVTTAGTTQSLISPDGTLNIHTLNVVEGASFSFDLGQDNIVGDGTLYAGLMHFSFTGGEVGTPFTLMSYSDIDQLGLLDLIVTSDGYILDEGYGDGGWLVDNGQISVQFSAIPEAQTYVYILTVLLGLFFLKKRRG